LDIDDVLVRISQRITLEAETEHEVLEEMRGHLEDAVADARARGMAQDDALAQAASRFGVEQAARELQETHQGWGTLEGIAAAALPVLFALILRWLVYAPDGTYVGWQQMLGRPALWTVVLMALLIPLWQFPRRRYALLSWAVLWGLSVAIIVGKGVRW